MSYKDFCSRLRNSTRMSSRSRNPSDLFCVGIDAVTAIDCREMGFPGFKGMTIASRRHRRHEYQERDEEPYIFHFPDGNASIARLLVRAPCPIRLPATPRRHRHRKNGLTKLDQVASQVRIRLNSTADHVKNLSQTMEVTYSLTRKLHQSPRKHRRALLATTSSSPRFVLKCASFTEEHRLMRSSNLSFT